MYIGVLVFLCVTGFSLTMGIVGQSAKSLDTAEQVNYFTSKIPHHDMSIHYNMNVTHIIRPLLFFQSKMLVL